MSKILYPRYRWFVFLTLSICNAVSVMILVAPAVLIGDISNTIGLGLGQTTAVVMVVINIFIAISAILGGSLIDRIGAYRVWIAGSGLLVIGSFLIPFIGSSSAGILFIRAVQGLGAGPIMASLPLVITQWFEKKERGTLFGIQGVIASFGSFTAMSFVPFVFHKTGSWQTSLFCMIVFYISAFLLSLAVYFGPKPPVTDTGSFYQHNKFNTNDIKSTLLLPATWSVLICIFLFNWVVRIFNDLLPGYLSVDPPVGVGMGSLESGKLMSGAHIMTMIGLVMGGIIMEKFLKGRPRKLVMTGFIVPAMLWYLLKLPEILSNTIILPVCILLGGFALSFTYPLIMAFISKNFPEHIMGKLGGFITVAVISGSMAGTAAGSYFLHITGFYHIPINLLSAGAFIGFLSAFFLTKPKAYEANI